MVSSTWVHTRLWCGSLPAYRLPDQEEAEVEKQLSKLYFDSYKFADLRMQIRLKIRELPVTSPDPGNCWEVLELLDEYLPLILSIQRYHSTRGSNSAQLPPLLTVFPPLFYGFGDVNLHNDRLIKQNCAQFCLPVELVLTLCTMAQLYTLHAERQILQGGKPLTIASWPRMQHAELSWQSAEGFYRWAASFAGQMKGELDSTDGLTLQLWRFFNTLASYFTILSRLCSTHGLSTHISGLALTEMRSERLARIGSVCARRALTLIREANSLQSELVESGFSQQLQWCLSAYETRWTAIYYQCELTVYRLDANPEIALYFCDRLLKLRIPHFSSPQDSSFAAFSHEIQLKHHRQLTDTLDVKKSLLEHCRGRFGTTWSCHVLDKCLRGEFLTVRDMGPVFNDQQRQVDTDEESNYASPFLVGIITKNVEEALLHVKTEDPPLSNDNECEVIVSLESDSKGLTECHIVKAAVDSGQVEKRPSSATTPGWVTMSYGGKMLHFEKAEDPVPSVDSVQDMRPIARTKPRPSSSPIYLSRKPTPQDHSKLTRASCALCERRFIRSSLPGVVVMKRVFELRRQWGVIQDSKKFNSPSVLYGTASVCLLCNEILTHEQEAAKGLELHTTTAATVDDVGRMIFNSIVNQWHQSPSVRDADSLEDIASNKRVRQSSTVFSMKAKNALDPDTNRSAHTKVEFQPWWEIDLGNYVQVHSVKVYLRDEVSHLYAAPGRHTTGMYPLHISVSMKTGVGRDCDDIVASCVTSLNVSDSMGPLVQWEAPPKSRGRFVRIQCQGRAILHIERVSVYVAKAPVEPMAKRQHFRQKLQRAAFCASVMATTAPSSGSNRVAVTSEPTPKRRASTQAVVTRKSSQVTVANESAAMFFDPERAERKRISRLYTRFKSLLDARAKYAAPEEEDEETAQKVNDN